MGGGTGTGGAPIVSQIAREVGALTVAVVTKPFAFEGVRRTATAEEGLQKLREHVHTLIVIPNDRVLQVIDKRTSMEMAFGVIDDVLRQCIQGISDLVTVPGLINLDFADVRTVMSESGSALMAVGSASGENRALEAARIAMSSPLLDLSMEGARGVLFNITGGPDLTLEEVHRAAEIIGRAAHPDANMIFGAVIDETMGDEIRMTVIATGFEPARRTDPRTRGGAWQLPRAASPPAPAENAGVPDPSAPEDWLDLPPTIRRPRKAPDAEWQGRPFRPAWDTPGDPRE
jgi:cell division protein FtsZ